jgi:hypothetical protein
MNLIRTMMLLAGAVFAFGLQPSAVAAIPADQLEFFEKRIRPILVDNCYKCHSAAADRSRGGLQVDTGAALLNGGDNGASIVAGDPDRSLLIKALKYGDPDLEMPPDGKLPDYVIRDFETWIRNGAPDPRTSGGKNFVKPKSPKDHWSFQPVFKPIIPRINKEWIGKVQNKIDYFIFSKLHENGLSPSPKADKVTLIRRATFNLTGLPPTLEAVDAFLADTNKNAFEIVIDRLLESKRYGERWGRHWMDVARYGDTTGGNNRRNQRFFHSYTYRDWVIKALNDDMPYPEFIRNQLAADRYAKADNDPNLAAMGFLTLGNRFNNSQDDIIDDRIDVVTKGFLGLTVTCARCHDHKFDPIPTIDYYSLHGIFRSSSEPREPPKLVVDTNSPTHLEYMAAVRGAEARVEQLFRKVQYDQRTEAINNTGKYLFAAYLARKGDKDSYQKYVSDEELSGDVVDRWKNTLNQLAVKNHRVFGMWHRFENLPTATMRADGIKLIRGLRDDKDARSDINERVWRSFSSPPRNIGEMANRYALLFMAADKEWQTKYYRYSIEKQKQPDREAPTALEDDNLEEIRQVIYDSKSPAFLMDPERWKRMASRELRRDGDLRERREELEENIEDVKLNHPSAPPMPVILVDNNRGGDSRVYVKGNRRQRGDVAPRRFLEILSPERREYFREGSGRKQLAETIASEDNPLTARVIVNRVWLHQFGEGIVRSPNDFGTRCDGPSHPLLLDYLAWNFMEDGWSLKQLQKQIMLSLTWQQSSDDDPRKSEKDPSNLLFWQMNRRRLDFEALRDTILQIGGKLDLRMGGPPVRLDRSPFPVRRSVYGLIDRANVPDMLRAFDFPNPDTTTGKRSFTIVPQQALFMMNSQIILQQAINVVRRGDLLNLKTTPERIQRLYRLIYSRLPNAVELSVGLRYLAAESGAPRGPLPGQPPWEYGVAKLDYRTSRVTQFWPIYYHNQRRRWQPGRDYPNRTYGNAFISSQGGHAANLRQTLVRRWTAPDDMLVSIEGMLSHAGGRGDGVQGTIIYSGIGRLGRWAAFGSSRSTAIPRLRVTAGSTVEFAIDCRNNPTADSFQWAPIIRRLDDSQNPPAATGEAWSAREGFRAPTGARRLYPWEKYAQVLLETNELTFIN